MPGSVCKAGLTIASLIVLLGLNIPVSRIVHAQAVTARTTCGPVNANTSGGTVNNTQYCCIIQAGPWIQTAQAAFSMCGQTGDPAKNVSVQYVWMDGVQASLLMARYFTTWLKPVFGDAPIILQD